MCLCVFVCLCINIKHICFYDIQKGSLLMVAITILEKSCKHRYGGIGVQRNTCTQSFPSPNAFPGLSLVHMFRDDEL